MGCNGHNNTAVGNITGELNFEDETMQPSLEHSLMVSEIGIR
jgi:hypothetical protein